MNGGGGSLTNGGGLEALLKAAKFVEEQEKQKKQPIGNGTSSEQEEVPPLWNISNGVHCNSSSRASPPPPRQGSVIREVHNKLEKNRRAHLKECFELLKKQVPASPDEKKTSNLSILHSAIRYIQALKRKEREFEHEMERLAREKIAHQQRLAALKKELTAQWEHIDFNTLLPESLETEPKRSNIRGLTDGERDVSMIHSDGEDLSNHPVRSGTLYSSTSSLSSASPLQTDVPHALPHHVQMVNPPGPPSLLVSPIQLLPQTTLRMIPADTQIVHSHLPTTEGNSMLSSGLAHVLNHPLVVPQSTGPLLLTTTSSQLGGKIMTTPILKTIGQMPLINPHHQYLVKPATMVVVSTSSNVPK